MRIKSIYFISIALLSLLLIAVGCSDDDNIENATSEVIKSNVVEDINITELLTMLEGTPNIYVTETTLTEADANATNDVHNVHYFGTGTDVEIDKALYRKAFENGHYFLVSDRNLKALNEILGHEPSVEVLDISDYEDNRVKNTFISSIPLNRPESLMELTDEELENIEYDSDTTHIEVTVDIPDSDHFLLFNRNMEMVIAIPVDGHLPQLTIEAMKDAIYKHQDDIPQTRASGMNLLASEPKLFSWEANFNYVVDGKTIHANKQRITASYIINSCYSYDSNRDYYMVQQEVTMYNAQLQTFKKKIEDLDGKHDFYVYAGFSHGAFLKAVLGVNNYYDLGTPDNSKFHLLQTSPATTTGSTTVQTGISYSIGGSIGLSSSGPSAEISGGVTFEDSRTMTIPDVSVKNVCGSAADGKVDDDRYTEWQFEIAWPYGHGDYWNTGHCRWQIDDVAGIGKTTAVYKASHLWAVDNPKENFKRIIGVGIEAKGGWKAGRKTWDSSWEEWWGLSSSTVWYTIKLDDLKRD